MKRKTPVTRAGLQAYDHLPPAEAALAAWVNPGSHERWHAKCRAELWGSMPLLARALDRMAADWVDAK